MDNVILFTDFQKHVNDMTDDDILESISKAVNDTTLDDFIVFETLFDSQQSEKIGVLSIELNLGASR